MHILGGGNTQIVPEYCGGGGVHAHIRGQFPTFFHQDPLSSLIKGCSHEDVTRKIYKDLRVFVGLSRF